jgi:hypothetical protein
MLGACVWLVWLLANTMSIDFVIIIIFFLPSFLPSFLPLQWFLAGSFDKLLAPLL